MEPNLSDQDISEALDGALTETKPKKPEKKYTPPPTPPQTPKTAGLLGWKGKLQSKIPGKIGEYNVETWDQRGAWCILRDGSSLSINELKQYL